MSYWSDVISCGMVVFIELITIIAGALLIQLVVYRLTRFSIYNNFVGSLIKIEKYIERNF